MDRAKQCRLALPELQLTAVKVSALPGSRAWEKAQKRGSHTLCDTIGSQPHQLH